MITKTNVDYYFLNQTMVDPDLARSKRKIIHENVVTSNGMRLFTLTFNQVLQDFGVRNWNGRVYTEAIVVGGLNKNPLIQHDLKNGTWSGEYGHPIIEKGMNELTRQMTIFPPNACWTIDKYWVEGNYLMGQCTTLAGGYGDLVRDRILTNYPAMASSRAIGGVDAQGNVLPGYTPITFDCVIRPSHKTAYMVKGTEHTNEFPIKSSEQNTMAEAAVRVNCNDPALADFLLSESASKNQISMICEAFNMDYDSMLIQGKNLILENTVGLQTTKVVIPINKMVNAEYYNLFK